jgi:S1/P1 Nuclease
MRALVLVVTSLASGVCLAWGPQGHRTVGALADRMLTPQARALVQQLLANDLDKFGAPSGRTTLEQVSLWADEVRGSAADHPRWHYDDEPVCGSLPKQRYCAGGQCNSEQLKRLVGVLGDPGAAMRERNEALKWVVHLVGDLHQPLHAADNADRGGNQVPVALAGRHTRGRLSLHKAWDTELVQVALNSSNRQRPPADLAPLAGEARRLVGEAGQGSVDSWATESNNLARNVAYHYAGFACNNRPATIVVLDRGYVDQAQAVVRERLLLAAARLAGLLNRALAGH